MQFYYKSTEANKPKLQGNNQIIITNVEALIIYV